MSDFDILDRYAIIGLAFFLLPDDGADIGSTAFAKPTYVI
jgi:hypothetical protein